MIQPGYTLEDILFRFGEMLGILEVDSNDQAALPSDALVLARMKRSVADAVSLMRLENPHWYCLRQTIALAATADGSSPENIDGDPTRFKLPWYVLGTFSTSWEWSQSTYRGGKIIPSSAVSVAQRNADADTGAPERVAIVAARDGSGWELQVAPAMDGDYIIRSEVLEFATPPTQLWHRSPFGAVHDQTLLAAAKWCWIRDDAKDTRRDAFQAEYQRLLACSMEMDLRTGAPATVGVISDPGCGDFGDKNDRRGGVTHLNDVPIN